MQMMIHSFLQVDGYMGSMMSLNLLYHCQKLALLTLLLIITSDFATFASARAFKAKIRNDLLFIFSALKRNSTDSKQILNQIHWYD